MLDLGRRAVVRQRVADGVRDVVQRDHERPQIGQSLRRGAAGLGNARNIAAVGMRNHAMQAKADIDDVIRDTVLS
jgi:hypothetical protein